MREFGRDFENSEHAGVFAVESSESVEFRRQSRGRRESGDEQISLDEADQSCGHFSKRNTRSLEFIVEFRYAVLDDVLKKLLRRRYCS